MKAGTILFLAAMLSFGGMFWQSNQPKPLEVDYRDHEGRKLAIENIGDGVYVVMGMEPVFDLTAVDEPQVGFSLQVEQLYTAIDPQEDTLILYLSDPPRLPTQMSAEIQQAGI